MRLPEIVRKAGDDDGAAETREVISQQKLRSLMKAKRSTQKDITEMAGHLGQTIATAVENDGLNRKIFNFCCSLDKMEPEKLLGHLDDLDHYLDISGLRDRAAKVQRLALGQKDEEGEEGEEGDGKKGGRKGATVKPFPAPKGDAKD